MIRRFSLMPNYRYFRASGAAALNFSDALKMPLRDYIIFGNSSGVGDPSKNLFNIAAVCDTEYIKNNGDGSLAISGKYVAPSLALSTLAPRLKVGDTAILSGETNAIREDEGMELTRVYLSCGVTWRFGTALVMTEEILASNVTFYATMKEDGTIEESYYKNLQIELWESENLLDCEEMLVYADSEGADLKKAPFNFENGKKYTMALNSAVALSDVWVRVGDGSLAASTRINLDAVGEKSVTFTVPDSGDFTYLRVYASGTPNTAQFKSFFNGTYCTDFKIEFAPAATEFEPYFEGAKIPFKFNDNEYEVTLLAPLYEGESISFLGGELPRLVAIEGENTLEALTKTAAALSAEFYKGG